MKISCSVLRKQSFQANKETRENKYELNWYDEECRVCNLDVNGHLKQCINSETASSIA